MSQIDAALLADLLRQAMNEGKKPFLTVISNSMSPLIRRGDQIQIEQATAENLHPGDIILFLGPANLITHRYWGNLSHENQAHLVTKGDRPQHFDQPFKPANLIGQVIGRRRNKRFLNLSNGRGGWLNRHLANLAKFEIRLFSKPLRPTSPAQTDLPQISGRFSNNSNGFFIRIFRRISYSWAIILTLLISTITSTFNNNEE